MSGEEIRSVCQKMYEGYGASNASGIGYFCQFFGEIFDLGVREVILNIINNYPLRYALDFLLSSLDLWHKYSAGEWLEILSAISPRPGLKGWVGQEEGYADIVFLCRYVQVDALSAFCGLSGVSLLDKYCTLGYFKSYPHILLIDRLDFEDLDGEYFVDVLKINDVRKRLIEHASFNEYSYEKEEALLEHIAVLEILMLDSK